MLLLKRARFFLNLTTKFIAVVRYLVASRVCHSERRASEV